MVEINIVKENFETSKVIAFDAIWTLNTNIEMNQNLDFMLMPIFFFHLLFIYNPNKVAI